MNVKGMMLTMIAAGWSGGAVGREVQVLTYPTPANHAEDLSTDEVLKFAEHVIGDHGVADRLAADWPQLAGTSLAPSGSVPSRAEIEVPLWMRAGVPPSQTGFRLISMPTGACTRAYRPRHDLHPTVEQRRRSLYPLVVQIACESGVAPTLLDALIMQESRYLSSALSPKGAVGLTQLMPTTARQLGVANAWSVADNIRGGARYLRQQLDEFGRIDLALAAYNAGPGRVRRGGKVPNIRETQHYVATILSALATEL